jgi:hypothetical protein
MTIQIISKPTVFSKIKKYCNRDNRGVRPYLRGFIDGHSAVQMGMVTVAPQIVFGFSISKTLVGVAAALIVASRFVVSRPKNIFARIFFPIFSLALGVASVQEKTFAGIIMIVSGLSTNYFADSD